MRRPSPALAVALLALFLALDGPAQAQRVATSISGTRLASGSVTGAKIRNGSLGVQDLSLPARRWLAAQRNGSVSEAKLASRAVTGAKLAPNAVTASKLGERSVTASKLGLRAVTSSTLASRAVTSSKLAPRAVDATAIKAGAVGTSELATGAVTRGRLGDDAVTTAKVADGSLNVRDVAASSGVAAVNFPLLLAGQCVPATVKLLDNVKVSDDLVVVTPPTNWPDLITVTGKLGPDAGAFTIVACNFTGASANPGPVNFRYAVLNH